MQKVAYKQAACMCHYVEYITTYSLKKYCFGKKKNPTMPFCQTQTESSDIRYRTNNSAGPLFRATNNRRKMVEKAAKAMEENAMESKKPCEK